MNKKQFVFLIFFSLGFICLFQSSIKENYKNNNLTQYNSINPSAYTWECDAQGIASYIFDGDTFDVDLIGVIRLADIDAPEEGEAGYQEATEYLNSSIFNKNICLDIDDIYGTGPFGRIIAVAYIRYNSTHYLNINKDLLDKGYANISDYDNEFNPYKWTLYVANNTDKADIKPFPLFLFLSLNNNVNKSNFKVTYFGIFGIIFLILNITAALIIIIYYKILLKSSKEKRIKATSYDFNNYFPNDNFKKVKIKANI